MKEELNRALALHQKGQINKAEKIYLDLLKSHPNNSSLTQLLGTLYLQKKNYEDKDFKNWKLRWNERLKTNNNSREKYLKLMKSVNPLVIPRNHKVEEALNAANQNN